MRAITLPLRFLVVFLLAGLCTALTAAALAPTFGDFIDANPGVAEEISVNTLANNSFVYAADGTYVGTLHGPVNRELTTLDQISDEAVQSVLAIEDADFYIHNGVNARSIIRALVSNIDSGGISQGGSTITQQVVKNSVLGDSRQEVDRKVTEAALALRLEKEMSKDEILELYLNTVYFGAGAYGVKAAADVYFEKEPSELNWADSALLASLIKSPSGLDPTLNPEGAQRQRRIALRAIQEAGLITADERGDYEQAPLPSARNVAQTSLDGVEDGYFLEEVKQQLLRMPELGTTTEERIEAIFAGGLRITTTIDQNAQLAAETSVADTLRRVNDDRFTVALASVEPGSGAVRALIGGPGFENFKFNIATQKGRPVGSSIKPFVLAAAMEAGYVPADTIDGTGKCEFENKGGTPDPYSAENFGGSGGSYGDLTSQTMRSSNCAYLRLGQIVGLNNVISTAHALGVSAQLPAVLSLPLGVPDITPLEMANSYASIANDGVNVEAYFVERVEDRQGKVIYEHRPTQSRAISVQSARLVTSVLEKNVNGGTGTKARLPGQPAAGKTGTSSDFSDAWFVGFTPYLSTAVWMGNAEASIEMRNVGGQSGVTGGSFPAEIWGAYNKVYHEGLELREFTDPERTRAGKAIRTDADEEKRDEFLQSSCGSFDAFIDTDGDGVRDACAPDTSVKPVEDRCPTQLTPVDEDGDGKPEQCVVPPPTTTTTTPPPTTTAPSGPGPTVAPPPPTTTTASPPPTTPPTTSVTTTTIPVVTVTTP